jgi:glycosyltransferase involved in cell wall biosynthesis
VFRPAFWQFVLSEYAMSLVTVIIPMFNGEATLQATLESVSKQTHKNLEVLIVNDGSTDGSPGIARRFCQNDHRFTLINQKNGGVASARNLGIERARADYIAVIDADDLWHPQYIEKLLRALIAGGEQMAFTYALNRRIDERDNVIGSAPLYGCEGRVLCQHTYVNFVGNGSALLMRKAHVLEVGLYDEFLHENNAQGCEDWLMQMKLAENYLVGLVPEYLVGYRKMPGQMSENCDEMSRSLDLVMDTMFQRCSWLPQKPLNWIKAQSKNWKLLVDLQNRNLAGSIRNIAAAFYLDPIATIVSSAPKFSALILSKIKYEILKSFGRISINDVKIVNFYDCKPDEQISFPRWGLEVWRLGKLRRMDQNFMRAG